MVRASLFAMLTEVDLRSFSANYPLPSYDSPKPIDCWRFQQPDSRGTHLMFEIPVEPRDPSSQTGTHLTPGQ